MKIKLQIKKISAEETYPLRLDVLKTCDAYEYKYDGDLNNDTIHLGACNNDVVGIVSLMNTKNILFKGNQIQLRGMAIASIWQGSNIGNSLLSHIDKLCKNKKIDVIWCNARENATQFYKKQGFKIYGDSFHIKNVGIHYVMFKEIGEY